MNNSIIEIPNIGLLRLPISDTEWVERYYGRFTYGNILTGEMRLYSKDHTKEQVADHLSINVDSIKELENYE